MLVTIYNFCFLFLPLIAIPAGSVAKLVEKVKKRQDPAS